MRSYGILLALTATLFSACSTLPANKQELLNSVQQSQKYCYPDPLPVVSQRLRTYLFGRYRPVSNTIAVPIGGMFVPIPSTIPWKTEEDAIPSGTQFTVSIRDSFVLGAQVTAPTQGCTTELKVFAGNSFWAGRYETLDKIARGEKVDTRE